MAGNDDRCWCCEVSVVFDGTGKNVCGSPLGGAWSALKCDECIEMRATLPFNAIWGIIDFGVEEGRIDWDRLNFHYRALGVVDREADGFWDACGPVHIREAGEYIRIDEWIGTKGQISALSDYRAKYPRRVA
jgi:hypothetical protein